MMSVAGFAITTEMVYVILIFGIVGLLQPWSKTWKVLGVTIGFLAYGILPFVISG